MTQVACTRCGMLRDYEDAKIAAFVQKMHDKLPIEMHNHKEGSGPKPIEDLTPLTEEELALLESLMNN